MSKKTKHTKQNREARPRRFRWWRVIMWTFLGYMYAVTGLGMSTTIDGIWFLGAELIALIFGLTRFFIEQHIMRRPEKPKEERVREYQVVGLSFVGYLIATATNGMVFQGGYVSALFGLNIPLFAAIVAGLTIAWQKRKRPVEPAVIDHPMSQKLANHYEEAGLSDSEIAVFRETMAGASKNIHSLETTVNSSVELQDILREFDTMNVIHAYFKAIVNEPKRMTESAPFLYEQLPNMADLTRKYVIITRHEVKTADTYLVLNQAKDALAKLAATIRDEYAAFVHDDIEDLDTTVTLTKQQLARHASMHDAQTAANAQPDAAPEEKEDK
ncbi:5-bromo-4-chloroindolyl phosphate hydrolysis family protein [Lacticaseibacillus sharpeae]|nr:5-bromo-4-chloroindolyl phosphate hydrolysis family protein [Lacticaseibacillus sharpeae]